MVSARTVARALILVLLLLTAGPGRAPAQENDPEADYARAKGRLARRLMFQARMAYRAAQDEDALRCCREAFLLRPFDANARDALLALCEIRRDHATAAWAHRHTLDVLGADARARASLARALLASARPDEAAGVLDELVASDDEDANLPLMAARVLAAAGRTDAAARALDAGLIRFGRNPHLTLALARVRLIEEHPAQASALATSALAHARTEPLAGSARRVLAGALRSTGNAGAHLDAMRADYEMVRDEEVGRLITRADAEGRRTGGKAAAAAALGDGLRLAADADTRAEIAERLNALGDVNNKPQ